MHHDKIVSMNPSGTLTLEKLDSKIDSLAEKMDAKFDLVMEKMDAKFDFIMKTMDARFAVVDEKFESIIELMMAGFESVYTRFDRVDQEIRDVKTRVGRLEDSMEEVQYSLAVLTKAEEKDAEATINHEGRIQRLEKINKIKAIPPTHLIDIQI